MTERHTSPTPPRRRRGWAGGLCLAAAALLAAFAGGVGAAVPAPDTGTWFERFKAEATAVELYRFLYAMPKGGDLHNHLSGSVLDDWLYDLALAQREHGYHFYTRVRIDNCRPYGGDAFGQDPYLLLFLTVQESTWEQLPPCEQGEFVRLEELDAEQRRAWLNSMVLDKAHEGRDEFFQTHWQRMGDLYLNPYFTADALVRNMQAFGQEGLLYLETMVGVLGFLRPDGSRLTPDEMADVYRQRLREPDAVATGVALKLQVALLRFAPNAEDMLRTLYAFVARNRDLFVAVNMVGREDNDKGYPLRFLDTLRELRREHHGVRLAIHAGEVDEPNHHVRDTLLLGADRIGHGVNLITDPATMRLMRHGPYLVEINLISNLLLEYVDDYAQHPFPEYLRTGIPVALSTDDRGMWDSNLTDEFFVAVREFNLSWDELVLLSRNSLSHSFAPERLKIELLSRFALHLADFERRLADDPAAALADNARSHGFLCRRYALCDLAPVPAEPVPPEPASPEPASPEPASPETEESP
ncbi:adenosine deaminase family protein [Pseudohaliea rubra]|uniref:Adenosine deaminase n=1 Tax=Pseudohaliea rubra DSM 19751 TaxID=1265313 RepID=A0A095VTA6_9GAMM|nr:adenosine deaminase [Pseudohaliea rubra]KGE04328.1 Adenosine deaminase [Pseudohaliea rubra DSM 19751]